MREIMALQGTATLSAAKEPGGPSPAPMVSPTRLGVIRHAVIIYNPASGRRRHMRARQLEEAQRALKQCFIDAELCPTTARGSATEQARAAVTAGAQLVVASGGDGTVNEVVNGLAGSHVPLGILPAGTANVLAKELALPWDAYEAARLLAGSRLRRVALGAVVSDAAPDAARYFISLAGAGSDGEMVRAVNPALKKLTGQLAYWAAGFLLPLYYRFPYVRVRSFDDVGAGPRACPDAPAGIDGKASFAATKKGQPLGAAPTREAEGSVVVIGRTKHYGGPIQITTGASLYEDCFEVAVFEVGFFGSLRLLPAVLRGVARGQRGVQMWKTQRVRCEPTGSRPIYAQVDGEFAGALPMEFRIVPDALTLAVPGGP
ncbi:MAG: diacylglycerol/lipid kinase family protein [Candidatus Acidiferrales bacterium]